MDHSNDDNTASTSFSSYTQQPALEDLGDDAPQEYTLQPPLGSVASRGAVESQWDSRSSGEALTCDPRDDYIKSLRGHNWDSWMARSKPPHTPRESYRGHKPRVPCDGYWRTNGGSGACAASHGSPASTNSSLKKLCNAVLDNGYEKGRLLAPQTSRLEGWPHLGADSDPNQGRVLPSTSSSPPPPPSSSLSSPWPYSYPLSEDGSVEGVGTLELLALLSYGAALSESSNNKGATSATSAAMLPGAGGGNGGVVMNRFAANFGANDGKTSDPVASLYQEGGWRGLAVELEQEFCERLEANLGDTNATLRCPLGVTPFNAVPLLEGASAPLDIDYLKIDIDSYDCDVLASILAAGYRPKVIQMETGTIPPPVRFAAHFIDPDLGPAYTRPHAQVYQAFGCSLSYVEDLLKQYDTASADAKGGKQSGHSSGKGHKKRAQPYVLIEASLDSIWVRKDVLDSAIAAHSLESPSNLLAASPLAPLPPSPLLPSSSSGSSLPPRLEGLRLLRRMASQPDALTAYVNGFWRWPWRRELHIWEIGTEHWFLLSKDEHRLLALRDHMACVDACFHTPSPHASNHHHHHHHRANRKSQQKGGKGVPKEHAGLRRRRKSKRKHAAEAGGGADLGDGADLGGDDDEYNEEPRAALDSLDDFDGSSGGGSDGLGGSGSSIHRGGRPFHYTLSLEPISPHPPL